MYSFYFKLCLELEINSNNIMGPDFLIFFKEKKIEVQEIIVLFLGGYPKALHKKRGDGLGVSLNSMGTF